MKSIVKKNLIVLSAVFMMFTGVLFNVMPVYAASGDTTVYLTKTGKCYHADGCSNLRKSKIETTLQNAVNKGKKPCSNCNPPTLDTTSEANSKSSTADTSATTSSKKNNTTSDIKKNGSSKATSSESSYLLNTSSKKFHKSSCSAASKIKAASKDEYTGTRDELIAQGYTPCKVCNP